MSTRSVKFDFFEVRVAPDTPLLGKLMDEKLPGNGRTIEHQGNYYRVEYYTKADGLRFGTAIKMTVSALPAKAHLKKPGLASLGLAEDEALAGETAFMFAPSTMTLVLQRNMLGVSAGAMIRLLEELLGVKDLDLEPILDRNALNKFKKMKIFRSVVIKAAFPHDKPAYHDEAYKTAAMFSGIFDARQMTIRVNVGHGKGTLNAEATRHSILEWVKMHKSGEPIQKIEVSGRDFDDGTTEAVDLLTERMIGLAEVPLSGRMLARTDLLEALRQVYDSHKEELKVYEQIKG